MILNIGIYCDHNLAHKVGEWVRKLSIPGASLMRLKGIFGEPENLESASFSVQLRFDDLESLNIWAKSNLDGINAALAETFGDRALMMPAVLEEL